MNEIYPAWKKRSIIPTLSATRELLKLNLDLYDVLEILEDGFDCSKSKRKSGVFEQCIKKKNKIFKVVVVEDEWRWSGKKVWTLTHVGVLK